jgi:riboflavin biosynthesis pyrimidine reductase
MALEPFEILYEADSPAYKLPADLHHVYGRLGFAGPMVYSNFVASVDGVVTLGSKPSAGSVISGKYPADRFLMGLLRACADAVLIGAGTLRATPGHLWTPAHVYPELATEFIALRSALGRATEPQLVVITSGGDIDPSHPALVKGALVITTDDGAKALGQRLPPTCKVIVIGKGDRGASVDLRGVLAALRARRLEVILTEGGPHLMGELIEGGLLEEVFLTISPVIAGRDAEHRMGMIEGVELLPKLQVWGSLLSARRHGDYLFLRYRMPARVTPS